MKCWGRMKFSALFFLIIWVVLCSAPLWGAERDPLQSRVPADQLGKAKALKNPYPPNAQNIAKGSVLYHGKGTCFTCHGKEGKGDGLAAPGFDPSPRDFTNRAFHKAKTDGELFWVIKNGSPRTAMMPMIGSVINEEEGWLVLLYERSLGQ